MLETWRDVESYRTAEGFGWEVPRAAGGPKKWGSQLSEPATRVCAGQYATFQSSLPITSPREHSSVTQMKTRGYYVLKLHVLLLVCFRHIEEVEIG